MIRIFIKYIFIIKFQAPCFKITTCDPKDDVVDEFSSLSATTAR